jgi:hypothetical protein
MSRFSSPGPGIRLACLTAALALWAGVVRADPVTVRGGISLNALEGPLFDLAGPTFRATVDGNPFNNGFDLVPDFFTWCGRGAGRCFSGDSLQMGGTTNGDAFIGTGTVVTNGVTFTNAQVFLDGVFVAPPAVVPGEQSIVSVTSPFTFSGTLRAVSGDDEILRQALIGSGTAAAQLFLLDPGAGFADENNAIGYRFDASATATPEPATLLLMLSGVAGLTGGRWTRGRASRRR